MGILQLKSRGRLGMSRYLVALWVVTGMALAGCGSTKPRTVATGSVGAGGTVVTDSDGEPGPWYLRGQLASVDDRLKKTLNLEVDPAQVRDGQLGYLVIHSPYFPREKQSSDRPLSTLQPRWKMRIEINGRELTTQDVFALGSKGWHWIPVSSDLLRRGENEIVFSLPDGGVYVYVAIDPDTNHGRSAASNDAGKTWSDILDPTHIGKDRIIVKVDGRPTELHAKGEYMVQLRFRPS